MAFKLTQAITRLVQLLFRCDGFFLQVRVSFLGLRQLHVQRFKTGFGFFAAGLQLRHLGLQVAHFVFKLALACAGLLGLLLHPHEVHLQRVCLGLGVGGFYALLGAFLGRLGGCAF